MLAIEPALLHRRTQRGIECPRGDVRDVDRKAHRLEQQRADADGGGRMRGEATQFAIAIETRAHLLDGAEPLERAIDSRWFSARCVDGDGGPHQRFGADAHAGYLA
jgi:hypothetical protein